MARSTRSARGVVILVSAVAVAVAIAACGGGSAEQGACGPTTREALDPAYLVHVLGDGSDVEYTSDPPTSGPHQRVPPVSGMSDAALARPVQVGILERGDVLLQYDPDLEPAAREDLEALAGDHVVVAPNPDLSEPVVATAWLFKRTCRGVDVDALEEFVDERVGNGPEG